MLFMRGRHALWHGLGLVGLRAGDHVLVPAYHHGSEIEALVRAGLVCEFYEVGDDLAPDEAELESRLDERIRALYLIHYLGFAQDGARWRRWCDDHGLLLLEDAAQSWLSAVDGRPLGSFGDLAIFCLYKTFGLPDGGALLTASPAMQRDRRPPVGLARLARRHAAWAAQRSAPLATAWSRLQRPAPYDAADDFALGDPTRPPSSTTLFLLPRVDRDASSARRLNYRILLDELSDLVPSPFGVLADGVSPFAFPIASTNKEELRERLAAQGVSALDIWSVPHPTLPAERFPNAAAWRRRLLGLPVHQELTAADLDQVARAVRPSPGRARLARLDRVESLEAMREEWHELAPKTGNIFATWEWASVWWRHFGARRPLFCAACRSSDGRLVAVLPLYLWRSWPSRVLRLIGHGPADELGPVCAPADRRSAAAGLRRFLAERRPDWDLLLAGDLPSSERWSQLLGGHVVRREASPILRASGGWDEYLAGRSANLRQQVRRRERALAREHDLQYRLANDPSRLQADLDGLFALHGQRWDAGESPFAGAHQAFHREFTAVALERGWLRLWFLELDGHPRAAWYGFRFEGIESYYQAGYDASWREKSVGFVLLAHTIRAALEDGVREYRFLRGNEPFKYRFADHDPGLETVAVVNGARGAATLAAGVTGIGMARAARGLRR